MLQGAVGQSHSRRWSVVSLLGAALTAGCAGPERFDITAEQFRLLYEAPRPRGKYAQYLGMKNGLHTLSAYELRRASWPEFVSFYQTPPSDEVDVVVSNPQQPVTDFGVQMSADDTQRWIHAWQSVPQAPRD